MTTPAPASALAPTACLRRVLATLALAALQACGGGSGTAPGGAAAASDDATSTIVAPDNSAALAATVASDTAVAALVNKTPAELVTAPTPDISAASASAPAGSAASVPSPAATPPASATAETVQRWSDKATWGGVLPSAHAEVVIPAGKVVLLDIDPPALAGLHIEGTLRFDRRDTHLQAGFIELTGALEIGSPAQPFAQQAVITLDGTPQAVNDGVARGLMVHGGRLALHGTPPSPAWTRLNEHADAGTTRLTLKDPVANWKAGDTVAVAPTDYWGVAQTERFSLASASGTQLVLASGLAKFRWGRLQYVTNGGMSLTPDPAFVPPTATSPTQLDERAAVANLSRNIVLEGADDVHWKAGFGAHLMIMDLASQVVIDGVEFRRVGQAGVTGRYPVHWHLLSYAPDGSLLGDATGHVLRNSAIWGSANRCVVIHATNGVQVRNTVCEDIKGHAFFLEDAVERRNVLDGNLALMTRVPPKDKVLQVHETVVSLGGPSGFWLTNPDNTVTHNLAGDSEGNGFWLAYPHKPLGLSTHVALMPDRMLHATFADNTAHSARSTGIQLFTVPVDAGGNVAAGSYSPTTDGLELTSKNVSRFELRRNTSYKNGDGAYRNVAWRPDYVEWTTADNYGTHFAGSVQSGTLSRSLSVGYSLNNLTPYPKKWQNEEPSAYATYHSLMDIRDNVAVNFPFVAGKSSGVFRLADYYMRAVEMGTARNTGNRFVNSHPGYHNPPPDMDGAPLNNRHWTLAGAFFDANGYWGPKGWYPTFDVPFLTHGANCQWVEPAGQNGKTCEGPFYGVGSFNTDWDMTPFLFQGAIEAIRQDDDGREIGRWTVGDGRTSTMLGNMRHFATRPGGRYVLNFPGHPLPTNVLLNVSNAYRASDSFLLAVAFDGRVTAAGYTIAGAVYSRELPKTAAPSSAIYKQTRWMAAAGSLAEVAASAGDKLWQDRANNRVWFKYQGGLPYPGAANLVPNSDDDLARPSSVAIYAKP